MGDQAALGARLRGRLGGHREPDGDLVGQGDAHGRIRVGEPIFEHRTDPLLDTDRGGAGQVRARRETESRRRQHTAMLSYRGEVCRTTGPHLQ